MYNNVIKYEYRATITWTTKINNHFLVVIKNNYLPTKYITTFCVCFINDNRMDKLSNKLIQSN